MSVLAAASTVISGCADPEALADLSSGVGGTGDPGGSTNTAPAASFTTNCSSLVCNVDGSISFDSDGTIASFRWDFGDGATATGTTANHTYGAAGSYAITLTVTDDGDATATSTQTVTVAAGGGGNSPPSASFTASCTKLSCTFDGGGSSDSDGTVASYDWDFGDGAVGGGAAIDHVYADAGSYMVTLTVTDNVGASSNTTRTLSVSATSSGSLDGQALYDQKCASCHGADATGGNIARISIVGATATDIQAAIDTVPNMSSLTSTTAEEIQAIADFLGTLVTGTSLGKLGNTLSKITIIDADGTTVTTESDANTGTFLADGSVLDGNLLAKAYFPTDGTILYGFADGTGVLNITPLTSQVLELVAGDALAACADSSCGGALTTESVAFMQASLASEMAQAFQAQGIRISDQWMNVAFDYQLGALEGMAVLIDSLPVDTTGR